MMLTSGTSQQALRVALVTTHLPLQQIPAAITDEALDKTLAICAHALHQDFGIERPRIAVTGLNPHAGESGHMGREDLGVKWENTDRVEELKAAVAAL